MKLAAAFLLILLLFESVDCKRECQSLHVQEDEDIEDVEFFSLPESLEGRIPVPFAYKFDSGAKKDAALIIHVTTGDTTEDSFYSLSIQRKFMSITKTDTKTGQSVNR